MWLKYIFATWSVNGNTPLSGGFTRPFGGGLLTPSTGLTVGTHYYVCSPHASSGMKGIIVAAAGPQLCLHISRWNGLLEFVNFTAAGSAPSPIAGQLNSNSWAISGFSDGVLAFGGTEQQLLQITQEEQPHGDLPSAGGMYSITSNPNMMIQASSSDMTNGTNTMRIQNNTGSVLNNFNFYIV